MTRVGITLPANGCSLFGRMPGEGKAGSYKQIRRSNALCQYPLPFPVPFGILRGSKVLVGTTFGAELMGPGVAVGASTTISKSSVWPKTCPY